MDYKVTLLLIGLLVLTIMIYREIKVLKEDIAGNTTNMLKDIKEKNDKMVSSLQSNMINCITQIKGVSSENLDQLEKITRLNNQPITKITTNHFTETDTSDENSDINYLSDVRNTNLLESKASIDFSINNPTNYYMSENSENYKSKSLIDANVCENTDEDDISEDINDTDIPVYSGNTNVSIQSNNDLNLVPEIPIYKNTESGFMIEEEDYDDEYNSNNSIKLEKTLKSNKSDDSNSILMIINDDCSAKLQPLVPLNTDSNEIEVDILNMLSHNISSNKIMDDVPHNVLHKVYNSINNHVEQNNGLEIDINSEEINMTESVNKLIKGTLINTAHIEEINEDSLDISSSDNIEKDGKVDNVSEEREESEEPSDEDNKENNNNFEINKLDDLLDIKKYNILKLKEICKSLSISLSHNIDGKRVYYKKNELYKNIKNNLIQKSSNKKEIL